jgi:hypothetical protein
VAVVDSVTVIVVYIWNLYFRALDGARIGGCSHLLVVAEEHRGL